MKVKQDRCRFCHRFMGKNHDESHCVVNGWEDDKVKFKVCKLDGTVIHTDINYKKLKFVNTRKRYLTERREMEGIVNERMRVLWPDF